MNPNFLKIPYTLSIFFFILSLASVVFFISGEATYVMAVTTTIIAGLSVIFFAVLIRLEWDPF